MRLAIFGASGTTGREAVRQAVRRGHDVRALMRRLPSGRDRDPVVEYRTADILSDDLGPVLAGCDAVISTVGVGLSPRALVRPPPLHTDGTRAILSGMAQAGVTRLVVVSACFVAGQDRGPALFRAASLGLDRIFAQMGEMEQILRMSHGIDWTAVRPAWLREAPLRTDYDVTPEVPRDGSYRTGTGDLAHFMLDCAESQHWVGQTPAIARPNSPHG